MNRKTVLIADTDPAFLERLESSLTKEGYRVLCESDGEWALRTFQSRRVDAVVIDLQIPTRSGLELTQAIRSLPSGRAVPVVLLSGVVLGAAKRAEIIHRYRLLDCIAKPIDEEKLIELLNASLVDDSEVAGGPASTPPMRSRGTLRMLAVSSKEGPGTGKTANRIQPWSFREVGLVGDLRTVSFPRLMHEFFRLRSTGALFLLHENVKKILYFRNGRPISVKSNLLKECLGQLLLRERAITPDQLDKSLLSMKLNRRLLGQELSEMGALSSEEISLALTRQLRAKILEIFGWPDGRYQFKESVKVPDEEVFLRITSATLVYDGIRTFMSVEKLRDLLAPMMSGYMAPASDPELRFQKIAVDTEGLQLMERIDGSKTLRELLARTSMPEERSLPLAYALITSGMAELWDQPVAFPPLYEFAGEKEQKRPFYELKEEVALRALMEESQRTSDLSHFELLGLDRTSDLLEVEQAWASRARYFHPDYYIHLGLPCQETAEAIFNRYREAYQVLRRPERRQTYESELDRASVSSERHVSLVEVTDPATAAVAAHRHIQNGLEQMRLGRPDEAEFCFRKAVELEPEESDHHARLGLAILKARGDDPVALDEAEIHLARSIELDPSSELGHLHLGHLLRQKGELEDAKSEYERALDCDPDCIEASSSLTSIQEQETARHPKKEPER